MSDHKHCHRLMEKGKGLNFLNFMWLSHFFSALRILQLKNDLLANSIIRVLRAIICEDPNMKTRKWTLGMLREDQSLRL